MVTMLIVSQPKLGSPYLLVNWRSRSVGPVRKKMTKYIFKTTALLLLPAFISKVPGAMVEIRETKIVLHKPEKDYSTEKSYEHPIRKVLTPLLQSAKQSLLNFV